ncbi:hypothetical protein PVAND_003257 [Polypedilum vanderplanki]|uniref:Uncharacterized protein n=1 Tax=Polypedilum vanderplanki TaxID=319348 RepID=A0A9J6BV91_POLVA|nr:hypothetical protein PVAND_003257 [Polypedilum vanderplanki]
MHELKSIILIATVGILLIARISSGASIEIQCMHDDICAVGYFNENNLRNVRGYETTNCRCPKTHKCVQSEIDSKHFKIVFRCKLRGSGRCFQ